MKRILALSIFGILIAYSFVSPPNKKFIPWLESDDVTIHQFFVWRGDTIDFGEFTELLGLLDSTYMETDPEFYASSAASITELDLTNLSNLSGVNTGDQDLSGYVQNQEGYSLAPDSLLSVLEGVDRSVYTITLPSSYSVSGRCSAAVVGEDYPVGWSVSADASPVDLLITHNLGKRIADVNVFAVDGTSERLLVPFSVVYSGIMAPDANSIRVEGLSSIESDIVIQLIFATE